ncbi:MAG: hypothetical protein ACJAVK_000281 [Akkermansiaceae bacterium]
MIAALQKKRIEFLNFSGFFSPIAPVISDTYHFGKSVFGTLLLIACLAVGFGSVLEAGVDLGNGHPNLVQGDTDQVRGCFSNAVSGCNERHAVCEEEIEEDEESDCDSSANGLSSRAWQRCCDDRGLSSPVLATKRYLLFCRLKINC